jgi:hypothetical protein
MRGGGRVGRAEPEDDHWELRGGVEQVEEVVAQALKRDPAQIPGRARYGAA